MLGQEILQHEQLLKRFDTKVENFKKVLLLTKSVQCAIVSHSNFEASRRSLYQPLDLTADET